MVIKTVSVSKPSRAPHASHATHAPSADFIVRARSTGVEHRRQDARCEAESEAGDVIDLGAPRPQRRSAPERRNPGRAVHARPPYTPNPRLYPGPRTKPQKPLRPKRAEARGNDGRDRRHKRVFRRPVPNSRLYRPTPPRPPPPPAVPRTTWAPPSPPARLETASHVALRLSEQRRGTSAPQSTVRARRSLVRAAHTPGQAGRSLVQAVRSPVRAARSPMQAVRSPVRTVRSPVRAVRSPVRAVRSPPVQGVRSPVRAKHSPVRAGCMLTPPAHVSSPSRRLVVTLPAAEPAPRYRPASEHFQLRSLDTDSGASTPAAGLAAARALPPGAASPAMDAGNRHSTSPEDCSEGNETLSAPSEFLAEFLSAIMRRQYAEALKYCRLILQYEPHNTTARGFYPLLQHKVQAHKQTEAGGWARGSSSEEASLHADKPQHAAAAGAQEMMEQGADESEGMASRSASRGSCTSQSSLELDSSEAQSSPSLSLSHSASAGCWESTGSEPDDNGNAPAVASLPACAADVQNDNAAPHKGESAASLRRLRAQFTCSIK